MTTYTATITPSNYTIATLCTALENGLNAATSTLHYSVSYSTVTNKITITNTNGDSFTVENGTSGNTLHCGLQTGFNNTSSSAATSQTGESCFNLSRTPIACLILGGDRGYTNDANLNCSVTIPVDRESGDVIVYEPPSDIYLRIAEGNVLDIALQNRYGQVLPMNGVNFVVILRRISA